MPRFLRQFGLRSLLIFCTLSAGCFGLWRWHMTWVHQQHEVAAQLAETGGTIRWGTWGPQWVHQAFGSFYFSEIIAADFHRKRIKDEQLELVRQIPTLQELYIPGSRVTDQGMAVLEDLPRLRKLALWRTGLTNKTLEHLGKLKNLEVLDIQRTKMNEEGLVHLRNHPRLQILRHDQQMTDLGIGHLASIPNLSLERLVAEKLSFPSFQHLRDRIRVEWLILNQPVYEEWATMVTGHPTITQLDVSDAPMTDQEFRDLVAADRIMSLRLTRVPITDEAIGNVPHASKLKMLRLHYTQVTPTGLLMAFGVYPRTAVLHPAMIRLSRTPQGQVIDWHGPINAKDIESLKYARNLKSLTVTEDSTKIQQVDFSWLARLHQLELLRVSDVGQNALLPEISQLKELSRLELDQATHLDTASLRQIADLPKLNTLFLRGSKITDQDMEVIGQMKQLQTLNISGSSVTDQGMDQLVGLNKLVVLQITGCRELTDEALRSIAKLPNLQYLMAQSNNFTDKGLQHLHGMPRLTNVSLMGTKRSMQGIRALRDSLPIPGGNIY